MSTFIDQVAALSWAATQVPEITLASQSFLKTGFLRAVHVEPLVIIKYPSRYKWISEFQDSCEILLSASEGPDPEKSDVSAAADPTMIPLDLAALRRGPSALLPIQP